MASIANSILSGLSWFAVELTLGSSSLTACVSSGAVMMKITSSTSITSISGTMLMSDIGAEPLLPSKLAKAITVPSASGVRGRGLRRRHAQRRHRRCALSAAAQRLAQREERHQLERERIELGRQHAVCARDR